MIKYSFKIENIMFRNYEEVRNIDIPEKLKEDIEKYYKENSYADFKRGNYKIKYLENGNYRIYKKKSIM